MTIDDTFAPSFIWIQTTSEDLAIAGCIVAVFVFVLSLVGSLTASILLRIYGDRS